MFLDFRIAAQLYIDRAWLSNKATTILPTNIRSDSIISLLTYKSTIRCSFVSIGHFEVSIVLFTFGLRFLILSFPSLIILIYFLIRRSHKVERRGFESDIHY